MWSWHKDTYINQWNIKRAQKQINAQMGLWKMTGNKEKRDPSVNGARKNDLPCEDRVPRLPLTLLKKSTL